ncbi:MAG: AAA family ATPase [Verrucomicrobia bacterium]|nr:AAA family ATPase [Verrucomicrobiota bacterium]MDA1006224.1 AAA family ATPase [Verrucomicrobiota bacterium]
MKLLSIRLHPFGGTPDRTCTLHEGMNVLEGPNEFGKSTLSHALWHGLFTPTNLTPAALRKTMGRWYPKPDGDHARVVLEFEAEGRKWTLTKTWGAGGSANLQAEGAAGIADPGKVQQQLLTLLRRNEATWRQVLFVGQTQLAGTVEELQRGSEEMDDLQSLLTGAAAIPGDVAPEKLAAAVDARVEGHFSRWDVDTAGPERGRGIEHPWANKVGPQLAAYYAMEEVRRDLGRVRRHEEEVDAVNAKIKTLAEGMAADQDFVAEGRKLREGLARRGGLEERCQRLSAEVKVLKEVMAAWPGAEQVVKGKEGELERVRKSLAAIGEELNNAKKRAQAEKLRQEHRQLVKAKEELATAVAALKESKAADPGLLAELKRLEPEIEGLRIQIAAQKLSATMESGRAVSVTVERGTEGPESVALAPAELWEGQAEGKFRVEFADLKISVESGTGDVAALFANLEKGQQRREEILKALGQESLAAVELAEAVYRKGATDVRHKEDLRERALQGRSEEEWAAEMAGLAALPETRSVEALEEERAAAMKTEAKLQLEIEQEQSKVRQWTREHEDVDSLMGKILAKQGDLKQAEEELAGLPELPEGFASVPDYLRELQEKESAREAAEGAHNELKLAQAQLMGAAPVATAEELSSALEAKEREFQRQDAMGRALLRIGKTLREIVEDSGAEDPMQGLAAAVSRHFKDLSCGRYEEVRMDGASPVGVRGELELDTTILSQGTLGSLALATRLALAELYLDGMHGFLLLDDPFTDLDEARRRAAMEAMGGFAQDRQVLIFTCHPQHAAELKEVAGAKGLMVAG